MIELDPGMAFGTGRHETTALCADLMEEAGCSGKKVLDVGCGSGILSIAAALLGSREILAVDIDDEAVRTAQENADKNGCSDRIKIIRGDMLKDIDFRADIVVANLIAEMIADLSDSVRRNMEPGGIFVSSGILLEKKDMVIRALGGNGFTVVKIKEKGEWCSVAAV